LDRDQACLQGGGRILHGSQFTVHPGHDFSAGFLHLLHHQGVLIDNSSIMSILYCRLQFARYLLEHRCEVQLCQYRFHLARNLILNCALNSVDQFQGDSLAGVVAYAC
jgi:hypothetical protein